MSKCNKTVVDHITPNSSRISHPYNDNIIVQIVRNYINLLHRRIGRKSSIHSEQLEDKIAKLERRNEPLNRQTPQSYTQQNLCAKIYHYDLYWPLPPFEHCFVEIGCKLDIIKGTYKAGVSYVLVYQVYNNSWSSFNTIPTHSTPFPSRARFRSRD